MVTINTEVVHGSELSSQVPFSPRSNLFFIKPRMHLLKQKSYWNTALRSSSFDAPLLAGWNPSSLARPTWGPLWLGPLASSLTISLRQRRANCSYLLMSSHLCTFFPSSFFFFANLFSPLGTQLICHLLWEALSIFFREIKCFCEGSYGTPCVFLFKFPSQGSVNIYINIVFSHGLTPTRHSGFSPNVISSNLQV